MTYSNDGTYVPRKHGGNTVRAWTGQRSVPPVTVTRKGKGEICRSYLTVMEAIPYDHRQVTGQYRLWPWLERVRGKYAGHTVQSWRQYCTSIEAILYEHRGIIVQAWTGHRSVPPMTGTNIGSCVCMILCLYDLVFVRSCVCTIL